MAWKHLYTFSGHEKSVEWIKYKIQEETGTMYEKSLFKIK